MVASGGDVLKFAGDALICMFGKHEVEEATGVSEACFAFKFQIITAFSQDVALDVIALRAVQCGLRIQSELSEYDSQVFFKHQLFSFFRPSFFTIFYFDIQAGFKLTLHIAVGVGTMHALWIGGVDGAWEFLVMGDPFVQLKSAVDNSSEREVVVSPEVWALVGSRCEGVARGGDMLCLRVLDDTSAIESLVVRKEQQNRQCDPQMMQGKRRRERRSGMSWAVTGPFFFSVARLHSSGCANEARCDANWLDCRTSASDNCVCEA